MKRTSKPPPPPPGRKSGVTTLEQAPPLPARKTGVPAADKAPPPAPPVEKTPPPPADPLAAEISFIEEEIRHVDPKDRKRVAMLLLELARLHERAGAKQAVVEEQVRRATEICPELSVAHHALRRHLRRAHKWDEVIASIDTELKVVSQPERRAALHLERGRILRDALKKPEAAARDLERAMTLVPDDASGPEALRTLYVRGGSWEDAVRTMERAAGASSPERALELRREAAVLRDHVLDQPGRATSLYDMVLAAAPADAPSVAAAERLYGKAGRWLELAEVLIRRAEASGEPAVKFASFMRAATIAGERLGDTERAVSWFEKAAEVNPDDPAPIDGLADVYLRAGSWKDLVAALEKRATLPASPAQASAHSALRAHVLADRLSLRSEAIDVLRHAVGLDPANTTLVHLLDRLLAGEGLEDERVELETLAAERIVDAEERAQTLYRIGESCERDPEGMPRAAQAYVRSLEAMPENRASFDGLRRIYERSGDWQALADLVTRRLGVIDDDDEKAHLLRRLAAIHEVHLASPEKSIEALERLRAVDRSDRAALWDLQRLTAATDRWKEHAAALRAEADLTDDPARKADLLWRCGVVAEERIEEDQQAWDAYEQALEALPTHRMALEALARVARECSSWSDHLELADRAMQELTPAERADRLVRTARISAEALGDEAGAVRRCQQALEQVEGFAPALEMLRRLHETRGEWRELADVMEKMAGVETDATRRAALRVRLADILAEHLDSPAEAGNLYSRALQEAPGYGPALEGLERVGLLTGDWKGLVETYRQAAEAAPEGQPRVPWLRKLAVVLAWRLQNRRDAIAVLERILENDRYDAAALRDLVALHLIEKQWQEAAEALSQLAGSTADPTVAAAYLKEEASLRATRLREDPTALLTAALQAAPDDRETLSLLENVPLEGEQLAGVLSSQLEVAPDPPERAILLLRLADVTGNRREALDRAVEELGTYLPAVRQARTEAEAAGDWARVVELLEIEGDERVTAGRKARIQALRRAADLAADTLGDKVRARTALTRAFELDPADERVSAELSTHLRDEGQWGELAEVLTGHARMLEGARKAPVLFDLACIQRDQLASPNEAARTLEKVLAIDQGHAGAHVALGDIYLRAGSWQKTVASYRKAEEALERHSALWRHARLRRVEVLAEKLGLFGDAERLVREALGDRADDRELLFLLARVLRGAQDWSGVEAVLDRLIKSAEPAEAAGLWVERGRMALALRDGPRVANCFTKAAQLSLEAPEAFDTVAAFAVDLPPADVTHLIKDVLFHAPAGQQQATGPMHLLAAQLMAKQGHAAAAEGEVRLALERMPGSVDAWILLGTTTQDPNEAQRALQQALGLDPFRLEIFQGLVDIGKKSPQQAEIRRRAAQVLTAFGSYEASVQADAPPAGDRGLKRNEVLGWVVHPAEPRRALELLASAGFKIGTLYPQPRFGVLEPLPPTNEVGRQVALVAKMFGVETYDAYYSKDASVTSAYWLDERPSVIVGPSIASAPQPLLRFHLGRIFALLASGSAVAAMLPPTEIKRLVEALAGQTIVNIGEPDQVQRVGKALGWMSKRNVAQPGREYAAAPEDLSGWQEAARLTSNRGGLLACADLAAARTVLHSMAGVPLPSPGSPETWEASRSVPDLGDLLAWAVSQEYASVRSRIV
jgi:tetratricopeptide (TPR) repeat protein